MRWYKKFRHILLIAIIFFVVTSFQTFEYLSYSKSIMQEQTKIAFREDAEAIGSKFQQRMKQHLIMLEALADYVVKEDGFSKEYIMQIREFNTLLSDFKKIAIADIETGEAAYLDGTIVDVSQKGFFQDALGKPSNIQFFQEEGRGDKEIILTTPLYFENKLKAVLIAHVSYESVEKYILSDLCETDGFVCVTDKKGNIIGGNPKNNHFGDQNNIFDFFNKNSISSEKTLGNGEEKEKLFIYSSEGKVWYSSYTPLQLNGWNLFYTLPEHIVTQNDALFDALQKDLIVKMLFINIAACIIIYFLIKNEKAAVEKENNCLRTAEEVAGMISFEGDYRKDTFVVNNNYFKQFGRNPVMHKMSDFAKPHPFIFEEDREVFMKLGQELMNGKETGNAQYRLLGKDGNIQWHQFVYRVWHDRHGIPLKCYGMIVPIDQQMKVISKLQMQVEKDPLTGVLNRMAFEIYANLSLNGEAGNQNHALLLLDLDDFKQINDGYGHVLGDHVLVATAELLKACVRNSDYVGRLGGDEFAVFLKNVNRDQAAKKAAEICEALEKEEMKSDEAIVTCSIGIACFPQNGADFNELYLRGDQALYKVKGKGKNSYMLAD
ncbi:MULTISPECIES: diguanylate cyclase [Anaerotignum]|uniref:sensor domain-containing diguanylate cyclase n=1 Tax=Anaerotignum TaxID=2039240 RepID=UPI002109DC60|nr:MULTISPECIES: diguanylate cyclase [Anaerotignum]MCQ4935847.1 diguanylate cyclase [Anaerotignum propionicum]